MPSRKAKQKLKEEKQEERAKSRNGIRKNRYQEMKKYKSLGQKELRAYQAIREEVIALDSYQRNFFPPAYDFRGKVQASKEDYFEIRRTYSDLVSLAEAVSQEQGAQEESTLANELYN